MTLRDLLETFDGTRAALPGTLQPPETEDIEAIRTAAYEAGYSSGWEDALKADQDSRRRIEAEFERNIQNLAFTYHEAVDRVRGEMKTFVEALIDGFLPEIMPDMLRAHVRSELLRIADAHAEAPIEIVASPDCRALVAEMLEAEFSLDIRLVEDESLAERQVFVRIAETEVEVNLAPLVTALRAQFGALTKPDQDASRHGRY